jgi:hypothetical protein
LSNSRGACGPEPSAISITASRLLRRRPAVSGNTPYAYGGGIWNFGTATLKGPSVHDNVAHADGGGVFSSGTVTLAGSRVIRNTRDTCAPPGSVPGCAA